MSRENIFRPTLADYLGFDFLDSSQWLKFKFDGTIDRTPPMRRCRAGRRPEGGDPRILRRHARRQSPGDDPWRQRHHRRSGGGRWTPTRHENWTDVSGIPDPR